MFRLLLLSLLALPALCTAADKVQYLAVPYVPGTNVIQSSFRVGQTFDIGVFVRDVRPPGFWIQGGVVKMKVRGVFAAYCDLPFDSSTAAPTGMIQFASGYPNGRQLKMDWSRFDDTGGFSSALDGLGSGSCEVFRVRFKAVAPGPAVFTPNLNTVKAPDFDTLVYGNIAATPPEESRVELSEIKIISATVNVLP